MAEGMDRPWATFDALPVDLIQRIAAMIPDSSDPVTQRWVLALYPCTHANLHVRYVLCMSVCSIYLVQLILIMLAGPLSKAQASCHEALDWASNSKLVCLQDQAQAASGVKTVQ